ncbi:MAG: hypothetical protein WA628_10300, partial [Terriglobales bacterium]
YVPINVHRRADVRAPHQLLLYGNRGPRCLDAGLVEGDNLSVDGSFIEANASKQSRILREQLVEVAHVKHNVRQYLTATSPDP